MFAHMWTLTAHGTKKECQCGGNSHLEAEISGAKGGIGNKSLRMETSSRPQGPSTGLAQRKLSVNTGQITEQAHVLLSSFQHVRAYFKWQDGTQSKILAQRPEQSWAQWGRMEQAHTFIYETPYRPFSSRNQERSYYMVLQMLQQQYLVFMEWLPLRGSDLFTDMISFLLSQVLYSITEWFIVPNDANYFF